MINDIPLILITSDSDHCRTKGATPRHFDSPKAYSSAVAAAGGVPVLGAEYCPEELAELCDALLLSGGDDVGPELFGETPLNESVRLDPDRDAFEIPLTRAFLRLQKPILGICRGFQVLSTVMGGTMYQDLLEQLGIVHSDDRIRHVVTAKPGSFFYNTFGERFRTNSTHHQAVREPGEGLVVTAWSVEGVIEAYEHERLPVFGTQFHPERLTGAFRDARTPDFAPIFTHFIDLARRRASET